jgi:protein-S-isoprenylcysteine O-methyltransferase Ste14
MKDFEELKTIWQDQVELPKVSSEDILKQVRRSRRGFANKLLTEATGMLIVALVFAFIWYNTTFALWTTHLSMIIFVLCCFYYLFVQIRDFRSINNSELLMKMPDEYIDYIKSYRRRRYVLNTQNYRVYSIFIGIAFALYFIEVYYIAALWQTILGIVLTIIWFMLCYYFMQIYIRKEEERLGEMVTDLERVEKQFDGKES